MAHFVLALFWHNFFFSWKGCATDRQGMCCASRPLYGHFVRYGCVMEWEISFGTVEIFAKTSFGTAKPHDHIAKVRDHPLYVHMYYFYMY